MSLLTVLGAALGSLGVFVIFYTLAFPPLDITRAQPSTLLDGVQVRLQQARLPVTPLKFIAYSLGVGALAGLGAWFVVGTPVVLIPFLLGGFPAYWMYLEDQRNQKMNQYHHDLAVAIGIITNTWHTTPSLTRALEAVVKHGPGAGEGDLLGRGDLRGPGPGSVAADFDDLLRALNAGRSLRDALQVVADRRASSIFDSLSTALLAADESGAQAGAMLERQAGLTRRQVETFNDGLAAQRSGRNEIAVGALGPWAILLLMTCLGRLGGSVGSLGNDFFRTPTGQVAALSAAAVTVGIYVLGIRLATRHLLPTRVATEYGKEG